MDTDAHPRAPQACNPDGSAHDDEVDLSLIEYLLSLTPAQRAEKHYAARLFAQRMQQIARQRYGTALDALEEAQ